MSLLPASESIIFGGTGGHLALFRFAGSPNRRLDADVPRAKYGVAGGAERRGGHTLISSRINRISEEAV